MDEEQQYDVQRMTAHVSAVNSAVPVMATIDGKEVKLLKVSLNGHHAYLTPTVAGEAREVWEAYLKAYAARVPVEVTAREVSTGQTTAESVLAMVRPRRA